MNHEIFIQTLLKKVLGDLNYEKLILFGSRARGDFDDDSDLDILIIVKKKTSKIEKLLEDAVYSTMWDHDFKPIISLKVLTELKFKEAIAKGFSFYRNVIKEGIIL